MQVREVMTRNPVTVPASSEVGDALALLDRHAIGMIPVVSPAGMLVGVVTEAELLRAVGRPSVRTRLVPAQRSPTGCPSRTVVEVMNHQTVTVRADTEVAEVATLLDAAGVSSLPVIDEHHHVVGVIGQADIARALAPDAELTAGQAPVTT